MSNAQFPTFEPAGLSLSRRRTRHCLPFAAEALDPRMVDALAAVSDGRARLLLTPARLRHLGLDRTAPASVPMPVIDLDRVGKLALRIRRTHRRAGGASISAR